MSKYQVLIFILVFETFRKSFQLQRNNETYRFSTFGQRPVNFKPDRHANRITQFQSQNEVLYQEYAIMHSEKD